MTGYRDTTDLVTASEAAYLQCPACKGKVLPAMKRELNMKSVWLRDGQSIDRDGNITGEGRRSRIASFWMEGPAAAYQTWSQLIYKYLAAEQEYEKTQSEETLKTVVNTDFGRPYLPRASTEQRKSELLEQRAEDVPKRCVPDGVCFLVATVDVQGDVIAALSFRLLATEAWANGGWWTVTTFASHSGAMRTVKACQSILPVTRRTGICC